MMVAGCAPKEAELKGAGETGAATPSPPSPAAPKAPQERTAEYVDPVTGMEFVLVKGGCFEMGDTFNEYHNDPVKPVPVHEVCLDDFYIGKYEVTQPEWMKVMKKNRSKFRRGNRPVERVSWYDAESFLRRLNRKTDGKYRLPTEAEWEYACRQGGQKVKFGTGKNLISSDEANYDGRSRLIGMTSMEKGIYRGKTTPVGSFIPNELGIHDMSGNVWEWTADFFSETYYKNSPRNNPRGPETGRERVVRGGGFGYYPDYLRCAHRKFYGGGLVSPYFGFRAARTP
ncbi:MAG: formylglycine-generating enzyme family protein [Thermodesulfobacteriota bacterium]